MRGAEILGKTGSVYIKVPAPNGFAQVIRDQLDICPAESDEDVPSSPKPSMVATAVAGVLYASVAAYVLATRKG